MVDESVTVKGSPARSLQRFIDGQLTVEQREELFRRLPVDYRERFQRPVLATEQIPVRMLNRLTEEAATVKGEPVAAFAKRAGRDAAEEAISGIYRFFARVMTPHALLSRGTQMWGSLYSRGNIEVFEEASGARIRLTGFPAEAAGCARIGGWIEKMTEMTGVKDVQVQEPRCASRGDSCCEWLLRWS